MAVNVSAITSVCLYCKAHSDADTDKDFHEIYDEVGQELQLSTLVETFFNIKVENDGNKRLCDDCVNHLIELYDLDEHAKQVDEPESSTDIINEVFKIEEVDDSNSTPTTETEIVNEESACFSEKQSSDLTKSPEDQIASVRNIENCNWRGRKKQIEDIEYENIERPEVLINTNKSKLLSVSHGQIDSDFEENLGKNVMSYANENEEPQELSDSTSYSPIEVQNRCELGSNEDLEFLEDDGQQQAVVSTASTNSLNDIFEFEITCEARLNPSCNDDQFSESENEAEKRSKFSEQNDPIEDNVYEEELDETLIDRNNTSQSEVYVEDTHTDEANDVYYEDSEIIEIVSDGKNHYKNFNSSEEENINSEETTNACGSSKEAKAQFYITDDVSCGSVIEEHIETSNDAFSLEEEYLIEEITCSLEFDDVDLNDYLDKVIVTKFEDLILNWETKCKLCLDSYNTFEDLLHHSCIANFVEEDQFSCTIKDCNENITNLPRLARHLILQHYDNLESLSIYGKCPDCQKTFSYINDFNKHSCCRTIKRKIGSRNYCQYCDMDFQSLKRYVFHMQFHLTNRRPKICLLCGQLFNNSNDFFEHTQYKHTPESAMACIKCDRFFKGKDVFDRHMDLHVDSKYQYSCSHCPKKYTNKIGLTRHLDIYHNKKSNTLKCSYCEKEFVNKASHRNHIKCHANDVQVESFICSTCGIITNNSETIKQHIESDKYSPCFSSSIEEELLGFAYTCENCSLDFHTIEQLKNHRLSDSHNDDVFLCGICRQSFSSLRHMRNHSIKHKDFEDKQPFPITRFFVCNIGDCQEFYPIWSSLYYHKKRPHKTKQGTTSPNKFKCQFCQQLCTSKMSLAVHVARSHNNSNIKCSHCNRSFKYQKLLQEHIDRYHIPVECDICYRKVKHRVNLEAHITMVHLNIKRFFCKHCEKGYFHKSERDIHEKKVHPETSYKCEICNFKTTYPESLEIHMDNHNNKLKFKCTICDKAFGRKPLLKCHLKRHLNKKEYSCAKFLNESGGCDETFLTFNLLRMHIKTKHPNSSYNINMQKDENGKRTCSTNRETEQTKTISYEVIDCNDDDSMSEKSTKLASLMDLSDTEIEQDIIELVSENDVPYDE